MKNILPTICPSCQTQLRVSRLSCPDCRTTVEGNYQLSFLSQLTPEDQRFALLFIKASGSLKELARLYNLSYPTIRNRLDTIIEKLKSMQETGESGEEGDHGTSA